MSPGGERVEGTSGPRLLVVVPTYQEAVNVPALIARVERIRTQVDAEVLVVDDGSPDGTAEVVERLARTRPWLSLLRRPGPMGLGSAYRAGFAWALERDFGLVGEMDADLSHDPAHIPALVAAVEAGADLALGSRYVRGGVCLGWPLRRRALSRAANLYARALLRPGVRDVTGGFRVFRREAAAMLLDGTTECQGYGFQIEGVVALRRSGMTIREVPIAFRDRTEGSSKMSRRTALEAARRCLQLAFGSRVTAGRHAEAGAAAEAA